jgi:hypothetical protein
VNAAPVGIGLPLGDDAFQVVLVDGGEERLTTPFDRQRLGDQMVRAPPQETPQTSAISVQIGKAFERIPAGPPDKVRNHTHC